MKLTITGGYLVIALSLILIVSGLYLISDISGSLGTALNNQLSDKSPVVNKSLQLMDKALQLKNEHTYFTYTGVFESPFRKRGSVTASVKNKNVTNHPERGRLYLKGILLKKEPLAILEDESGETYIRGIGEKVANQIIVLIHDNRVTLKDGRGSYELVVEEQ